MWVAALGLAASLYLWSLARRGAGFNHLTGITVIAMLLISPLSWDHYDTMLVSAVVLLWGSRRTWSQWAAGVWVAVMTMGSERREWEQARVFPGGLPSLLGRVFLLVVLVAAIESDMRQREGWAAPTSASAADATSLAGAG